MIKLLTPETDFLSETFEAFETRYEGFGKELYMKIKEKIPLVFTKLSFYQRLNFQTEDSYAEYNDEDKAFVIQLDPTIEVIVLWNEQKNFEIGTWSAYEYKEAIYCIKSEFLK